MDTRSYEYMIYIHYTFPKHIDKKKIQIQLPKDPQTNSEIIIPSLANIFWSPTIYQALEIKN